jgi:hypothetical protein
VPATKIAINDKRGAPLAAIQSADSVGQRRQQRTDRFVEAVSRALRIESRTRRKTRSVDTGSHSADTDRQRELFFSIRAGRSVSAARPCGVGNLILDREGSRFIRAFDKRLDSLMNESRIGAIRSSASSQPTRGGRSSLNASATMSNQAAHLELRIVRSVVRAIRHASEERGDDRARQVVGMNVIRIDIIYRR